MRLDKQASGQRWLDLQSLVNTWDPLGLIADGAPVDEYDCVVGLVLRLVEKGETPARIAASLDREFVKHFGVERRERGSEGFARQVLQWYAAHWKDTVV